MLLLIDLQEPDTIVRARLVDEDRLVSVSSQCLSVGMCDREGADREEIRYLGLESLTKDHAA